MYGLASNARARATAQIPSDNRVNALLDRDVLAFDQVCRVLSDAAQPYDVLLFPEGELRADSLEPDDLRRYRTIVVPACDTLTGRQLELLRGYEADGGRLVVLGELGSNRAEAEVLLARPGVQRAEPFAFSLDLLPDPQVRVQEGRTDAAVSLQRVADGAALHLMRYDYDEEADRVPPLDRLALQVRLPWPAASAEAFSPGRAGRLRADLGGGHVVRLELSDVPLYCIVLMRSAEGAP